MPAQFRDYYRVLGVSPNATHEEIRSAFRKLARQYHPDVAKDKKSAEEKFKEINEAYEVLGDPEKRKKYDAYGAHWREMEAAERAGASARAAAQEAGGGAQWRTWTHSFGNDAGGGVEFEFGGTGFSDFFEELFGVRRGRAYSRGAGFGFDAGPRRGADVEADLLVTIEEAFHGSTRQISFKRSDTGRTETYTVKIPKGVREGQRIRLAGLGGSGAGGAPSGDLYLRVKYQKHPDYRIEGFDLYHDLEIPAPQVVLGCEVEVPTPDGKARLKIPPGTQSGQRFRLAGRGLPNDEGGRGDFYVVVEPQLPKTLTPEARLLWEKLAKLEQGR